MSHSSNKKREKKKKTNTGGRKTTRTSYTRAREVRQTATSLPELVHALGVLGPSTPDYRDGATAEHGTGLSPSTPHALAVCCTSFVLPTSVTYNTIRSRDGARYAHQIQSIDNTKKKKKSGLLSIIFAQTTTKQSCERAKRKLLAVTDFPDLKVNGDPAIVSGDDETGW